jgi:hypothetical protein
MKKGKTSKIQGFKSMKVMYGTVDSVNFKSIYLNIQTWITPIKESENWSRIVLNMSRQIKHLIFDLLDREIFEENFIVDLDLRSSGITQGKKSFMSLEINFYLKKTELDFKSSYFKNCFKKMSKDINNFVFSKTDYFEYSLSKSKKELIKQS